MAQTHALRVTPHAHSICETSYIQRIAHIAHGAAARKSADGKLALHKRWKFKENQQMGKKQMENGE